jgi:hypothetical protein
MSTRYRRSPAAARLAGRGLWAALTVALVFTSAPQGAVAQQVAQQGQQGNRNGGGGSPDCGQVSDKFGRMFGLPAARWPAAAIDSLSKRVMAEEELEVTPEGQQDDEENNDIDAGFTYVGQFIDHDLTLDPRPDNLSGSIDPTTLRNFRTAAFDLDSVYGGGPSASPQLYEADGMHLKLGARLTGAENDRNAVDLPRDSAGQALLGDPRNDENRLVASLHAIFLRGHNLVVDLLVRVHPNWPAPRVFEEARRQIRLHYQWAVLTDFLPTIVGQDTMKSVLPSMDTRPQLRFYAGQTGPCKIGMPVEFSVAAYRFGHSMVRPIYRINDTVRERLPVFSLTNDPRKDLGGFRPSPSDFAIDWAFLFQLDGPRRIGKPQASYKLDNSLVFPLSQLPLGDAGTGPTSLAQRNLLRSMQLGLPSGQDVARTMGAQVLRDDQILIGKATGDAEDTVAITAVDPSFAGKAPLWTYILAEATAGSFNVHDGRIDGPQKAPIRLGPVGGRIVAETFIGLMAADSSSVLYDPNFRPLAGFTRNGQFGFRDFIRVVTSVPTNRSLADAAAAQLASAGDQTPATAATATPAR